MAYFNQGLIDNNGSPAIRWSTPQQVEVPGNDNRAWQLSLESDQVHLADIDADGLTDLVQIAPDYAYYYRNVTSAGTAAWGPRLLLSVQDTLPPSPYGPEGINVRIVDLDSDRRIDIISSIPVSNETSYQIWFNRDNQTYARQTAVASAGNYSFANQTVKLADMNGDGMTDIARIYSQSVRVIASMGHGNFSEERVIPFDYLLETADQINRADLQDITGDGLADLIVERAAPGELWFWVNRGNYTFESRRILRGLPTFSGANSELRWVDLNGNGTTDLVYADALNQPKMQMVDIGQLFGCVPKPHLLKQIDNGIGRITNIEYRTSVDYALEDGTSETGEYQYAWPDPLPFPVEVVSRVLTSDSLDNEYEIKLSYHDGYYEPLEKQFRGFARAEQTEIGDTIAPTLVTQSQFDTGSVVEAMKGKLLSLETRKESGEVFSRETTSWNVRVLHDIASTDGRRPIRYAHPTGTVTDVLELGQGAPRRLETEFEYDNYGNQTALREYGIVEDGDRSAFNDERITHTTYAYNLDLWQVSYPARIELQNLSGQVIARTETYYDDPDYLGANFGEVNGGTANLMRQWIDPTDVNAYINSMRTRYDDYGNPVALLDPLATGEDQNTGHYRELVYDPNFHTFPIQETLHVGGGKDTLSFNVEYDLGWGTLTRSRNTNDHATDYRYDTFGRPTAVIRPGDSETYPTMQFSYALAQPFSSGLINYVETRALDKDPTTQAPEGLPDSAYMISRSYVDGLGRALMSKSEAEPDPDSGVPRYVASGAVQFHGRAGVAASLSPYFSSSLDYEDIEAPKGKKFLTKSPIAGVSPRFHDFYLTV